ncbi:ROK family protein [Paracoccus sp. Z330]|uniref:N-acetylglucosamine kinase n=1 Tax=Paracoccus onchidii TaxID=3017813 RepID=A0ABT4ZFY6_9RHOB|nr:ROK family protein [Paracoccus onchidii]MDB6178267.1 ROK family protein [Paracoccus onchidii]
MICGGIDLGGTKIEARLFSGPQTETIDLRRIPTPRGSYDELLAGLEEQIAWLEERAGISGLPVGIAAPGVIDPDSGKMFTANLPASGHSIRHSLNARLGRDFPVVNDCMAFALSEARGGAGQGSNSVMGLILGTGVGGGYCVDGAFPHRHGGLAIEIGHVALPASAVARHDLPLWRCGCGRTGCMETAVSGTGLSNIAQHVLGERLSGQDLVERGAEQVFDIWADITGECLLTIQLMLDPDCIVLGGGLSNLPDVVARLEHGLARHALANTRTPKLVRARHGDSSGTRGAALLAKGK